jgi:hypothetical protein
MKFILFSCVLCVLVSATIDGDSTLYPGYVVNYDTPRGSGGTATTDIAYAVLAITGIDPGTPVNLTVAMKIIDANSGSTPSSTVRWEADARPGLGSTVILGPGETDSYPVTNASNGYYFLSVTASCAGQLCDNSIQTEISAWTPSYAKQNWPPYAVLPQRRTARFTVAYQSYLYFWLAVTDNYVKTNRRMKLYIRVDFTADKDNSGVQALAFNDNAAWPTATANVTLGSVAAYPDFLTDKGNWAMGDGADSPAPFALGAGLFQICFFNPVSGHPAQFTTKYGFNEPAKDAAQLIASTNLIGLIALSLACIVAQMKLV